MTTTPIITDYKARKQQRKKERGFGVGFFSIGTVVEVQINSPRYNEPREVTVKSLYKNGPTSFVFGTGVVNEHTGDEYINISHVKHIIHRAPGKIKIDRSEDAKYRQNYFDKQNEKAGWYPNLPRKHPSQYRTDSVSALVAAVAAEFVSSEQILDSEKMAKLLLGEHLFDMVEVGEYAPTICTVNKKKFRQAVKRLLNKCLVSPAKAQEEQNRVYDNMVNEDRDDGFDSEMDAEREDEREQFYEITNQYGNKQTVLLEGGKEVPVCASCRAYVRPNRGQGTICDNCAHQIEIEASHDYHDGILG